MCINEQEVEVDISADNSKVVDRPGVECIPLPEVALTPEQLDGVTILRQVIEG